MQTSLTFPKSSELQLDTEDELSVDPGILFSSEFRESPAILLIRCLHNSAKNICLGVKFTCELCRCRRISKAPPNNAAVCVVPTMSALQRIRSSAHHCIGAAFVDLNLSRRGPSPQPSIASRPRRSLRCNLCLRSSLRSLRSRRSLCSRRSL